MNSKGFSHHFILPVLAILAVGGIGVLTLRLSSAATYNGSCVKRSFSIGSKSECVRDVQKIVGLTKADQDAKYGNQTANAIESKTKLKLSGSNRTLKANSAVWKKLCSIGKSKSVSSSAYKGYQHACLGFATATPSTPKVTKYSITRHTYPTKSVKHKTVKYVSVAEKNQILAHNKLVNTQIQKDASAWLVSNTFNNSINSGEYSSALYQKSLSELKSSCKKVPGAVITKKDSTKSGGTTQVCKANKVAGL